MAATDLCTLADVREFLQKPSTDEDQDQVISSFITAYSLVIEEYCQREFTDRGTLTRTFEAESECGGEYWVDLAPHDLRSATSVLVDTDQDSPVTLTADEWRYWPRPSPQGTYGALRLVPLSRSLTNSVAFRAMQVQVVGSWGMSSVPGAVKQAAVITVAVALRRDVAAFSSTYQVDDGRVEVPEAVPAGARALLAPYRRVSVG